MNPSPHPLLQVSNLTVRYRRHKAPVINGISFGLEKGEICGITGESGCGKTTLAYGLINLLPANAEVLSGSICFQGQDLLRSTERSLRRVRGACISLASQDPAQALNPVLTVGSQVADVLRSHRRYSAAQCRRRVEELFDSMGLNDQGVLFAYPHQLSGGQRQRVVLAQALAAEPALLIADEPTSALDPQTQSSIMAQLYDTKQRLGLTLLFITHDLDLLRRFADRVFEMKQARITECDFRAVPV